MSRPLIVTTATIAFLIGSGTAIGSTCYTLYDRSDNVIYRDRLPPVDMSPAGDAQREALRRAGEFLVFAEADSCPPVEYKFGEAGNKHLSVDSVVGGVRPIATTAAPPAGRAGADNRRR